MKATFYLRFLLQLSEDGKAAEQNTEQLWQPALMSEHGYLNCWSALLICEFTSTKISWNAILRKLVPRTFWIVYILTLPVIFHLLSEPSQVSFTKYSLRSDSSLISRLFLPVWQGLTGCHRTGCPPVKMSPRMCGLRIRCPPGQLVHCNWLNHHLSHFYEFLFCSIHFTFIILINPHVKAKLSEA